MGRRNPAVMAAGVFGLAALGLVICAVVAAGALIASAVTATPAQAHSWYTGWCCNDKDCGPMDGRVTTGPTGYSVPMPDGTVSTIPFGDGRLKPIPENAPANDQLIFHACIMPWGKTFRVRCLYVPGEGA